MKRYSFLLLISCAAITIANAGGFVKLHGKIRTPVTDSIFISYNNGRLAYDPVELGIKLNKDGSFSTVFAVNEKFTVVNLTYAGRKTDLVAAPDNDLEIIAEGKNFDSTIHYLGNGNEVGNFTALHTIEKGLMENYINKLQPKFIDTSTVFKKVMATMEQDEVVFLNTHMSDLPVDFVQFWVSYYHFFSYFGLMQYPMLHEVAKLKTYNIQSIPPTNYASMSDVPEMFNDSLLWVAPYRLYVDQLYRMRLNAAGYTNMPNGNDAQKYRQDDSIMNLQYANMPFATSEYAVGSIIYANVRQQPIDRTERLFEAYRQHWPDSKYITLIERQIAIMKRLAKGQKAMDFAINTPQGASTRLSEMKGKVVLLCFWSATYEQGKLDLHLSNKLFGKYKDSGVAFIYVSIDGNELAWKDAIDKFKINGIHTHIDGWKSMLAELYGIQSVPTFFLIDKKGNFAVDRTPLPRQGDALGNELNRLLRE